MSKKFYLRTAAMLAAMFPMFAFAGTGGGEFDDIWITMTDWVEGTLGRIIAAGIVIVGIVAGIVRQSLMAFAIGIGGGMGLYNTPTIIEEILTATLTVAGM
jgi:conjugal transfer pilus assembly protein TraA